VGDQINPQTLRDRLELKQRELDLVLSIDHIRDTIPEPMAMLAAIVNVLTDQLTVDLCLLCLVNQETHELELKAVNDKSGQLGHLGPEIIRELARRVIKTGGIVVWREDELAPMLDVLDHAPGEDSVPPEDLAVVGICITLTDEPSGDTDQSLGVLLLARSQVPFNQDDLILIDVAESQIDSAVMQAYAYYELQQRNLELETIYRIDRIRDRNLVFDEMLDTVLHELCTVIQAGMGFIMLYDRAGHRLELRASTHNDLFQLAPYSDIIDQIANEALKDGRLVSRSDLDGTLRSVMAIPLILHNEIIGVLGVANHHERYGFSSGDQRLLSAIASQMDTAIFESLERARLRQVLGRSVDPRVMERLLANPDVDFLKGERSMLSVLYADIRGSTGLAERTDPELLVGFINNYLSRMTEVILSRQGTLDKFVGDEVMALFGAPFPMADHALRAVRVGLEMQKAHQTVMETWRAQGVAAAPIGIGIATGEVIVGEMGSTQRSDYTVIGRAANLGARICSVAKAEQVLISQTTYDMITRHVEATPITGLDLKGVGHEVTAYHVTRILD
jgi:adenylate cyclase